MVIIYLAPRLLKGSSELLITRLNFMNEILVGFVLAPRKDLAVSPSHYCEISRGKRARNPFGFLRLCSHLAHCCGRLLAATFLSVRTFLSQPSK